MDDHAVWTIHTDGAARGNPGPAAFAYTIERPGEPALEANGHLGAATNNIAEYTALVRALEHAHSLGGRCLLIHSDSELMVQQMNGGYKVKNPGILELYTRAKELCKAFEAVTIRHVRREQNSRADALCNEALDNPWSARSPQPTTPVKRAAAPRPAGSAKVVSARARARERALASLIAAAARWAQGDANQPSPESVCDEIWEMLRQEGLLN